MDRRTVHFVKHYLLVTAGITLGVSAVFGTNPIHEVFLEFPIIERLLYLFMAAAAVLDLVTHKANCSLCKRKSR